MIKGQKIQSRFNNPKKSGGLFQSAYITNSRLLDNDNLTRFLL